MPVGYNASEAEFNAVNKTGGDKAVTLTTEQIPSHSHSVANAWSASGGAGNSNVINGYPVTGRSGQYNMGTTSAGGGKSHSNIQPYKVLYMWQRTA